MYAKTFLFWDVNKDSLPLGIPQLAVIPHRPEHIRTELLQQRDHMLGVKTSQKRDSRQNITYPPSVDPNVDQWMQGTVFNLQAQSGKSTQGAAYKLYQFFLKFFL